MNIMKSANKKGLNFKVATVATVTAGLSVASQAFCISGQLNQILNLVWTLTTFAGIVMVAIGAVQLIRCVIALTSGDQMQPGQLGKAVGLLAAGIAAAVLKTVLNGLGVATNVGG